MRTLATFAPSVICLLGLLVVAVSPLFQPFMKWLGTMQLKWHMRRFDLELMAAKMSIDEMFELAEQYMESARRRQDRERWEL